MKSLFWLIYCFLPVLAIGKPFSAEAWEKNLTVYEAIKAHPFNQELALATLPEEKFSYYSRQDALYLTEFAKALAVLATKLTDPQAIQTVLGFVKDCLDEPAEKPGAGDRPAPFNQAYSDFLLKTAAFGSAEELAAALLPCFWIYLRVAEDLLPLNKEAKKFNAKYSGWLKTYSGAKYRTAVEKMIAVTDALAAAAPDKVARMHAAFGIAAYYEWNFWSGAYRLQSWKIR